MSVNQVRHIRPYTTDIDSTHQDPTRKKDKTRPVLGLVPQRKDFSCDESFQQVMDIYIFHCRRLEMVKRLRDCLNGNGG